MGRSAFFRRAIFAASMFAILPGALRAQESAIEEAGLACPSQSVSALFVESESLLRVDFPGRKNWRNVETGAVLEGRLSLPLYAGEQSVAPAGSAIRVTVNSAEKIRGNLGFWRKTGRAMVRAFNPLETIRQYLIDRHERKKDEMVAFARDHAASHAALARCATGTTGQRIVDAVPSLARTPLTGGLG